MLKNILGLLLSLLLMQQAFSMKPVYKDSAIQPGSYRLTREQFINRYGTDQASRALIQYYFDNKKKARLATIISGAVGGAAGVSLGGETRKSSPNARDVGGLFYTVVFLAGILTIAGTLFLVKGFDWLRLSRKRLLKQLLRYQSGEPLPQRIVKSSTFQKQLL